MNIITNFNNTFSEDPICHFHLEDYLDDPKLNDVTINLGNVIDYDKLIDDPIISKTRKIRLEFEEPNRFFNDCTMCIIPWHPKAGIGSNDNIFDHILTIDPFSANYLNRSFNNSKHVGIFFPVNRLYDFSQDEKDVSVLYSGSPAGNLSHMFGLISQIPNYAIISREPHNKVTHVGASYVEKMKLFGRAKVTPIFNLLFPWPSHINQIKTAENYGYAPFEQNEAFSHLHLGIVPQLKSRVFEAALNKTIILCQKDPWNLIEYYFEKDKEFIYFEDHFDMFDKIQDIVNNYDKYKHIAENAYKKCIENYTTHQLINVIKEIINE